MFCARKCTIFASIIFNLNRDGESYVLLINHLLFYDSYEFNKNIIIKEEGCEEEFMSETLGDLRIHLHEVQFL